MTLVNTLMQTLRSKATPTFDANELRESRYGALRFFQQESASRPIFDGETIANIKRSFGNSVIVPVLDAQTVTVSNTYARTCSVVDDENTSALVTLSFASYGWGFSMTPSTHYNNDVAYQRDWERKMNKYLLQFTSDLDTACIAVLEADKNQVTTGVSDYYAIVADALQVPQASKDDFYNQLEAIFNTMDFYDNIHIITNPGHMPMVRRLDNQGSSNATNQGFQFDLRGYQWWGSNRLANGVGVESTAYAVEAGTVFIDNRNDPDTIAGHNVGGFKVWSQEQMPMVNMLMGSFYQEDCGDQNALAGAATAGNTRSKLEGFEFSTDIVTATQYNSSISTRYNPILKAEILD